MVDIEKIAEIAKESGFTQTRAMDVKTLKFMPEVRDMCAADKCNSYNKSWSCPPACGELEDIEKKCSVYTQGIILQTVGYMEDEFDIEMMTELPKKHGENFLRIIDRLKEEYDEFLPMGAGACTRCSECTYPGNPCRFPEKVFPSMEACGLLVSQVCKDNDIPYYYGEGSIAYVACILFK